MEFLIIIFIEKCFIGKNFHVHDLIVTIMSSKRQDNDTMAIKFLILNSF